MRYALGWSVVWLLVLAGSAWGQVLEELPAGTRVVIVQEIPAAGRDIRVAEGEGETFHVASTAEMLARMEVGREEAGQTVVLTPRNGQAYIMRLQFVPDPEIGGKFVTAEEMRRHVESAAADHTDVAAEPKVKCRSLKCGGRSGCYATFTDGRLVDVAQPKPNDFRHVAVGIVRLSEGSVLQFQIFTNDLASRDFFGPLDYALGLVKVVPGAALVPGATRPAR